MTSSCEQALLLGARSLRSKRFLESKTAREMGLVKERERGGEERKETLADKPLACEYSRFSLIPATWKVLPGGTSASQQQKCQ